MIGDEALGWDPAITASRVGIARLGGAGLFSERWNSNDDVLGTAMIDELARRGLSSMAVVVSLHAESVIAMLRQFGRPGVAGTMNAALEGAAVGCVAASEAGGGSDLASVATTADTVGAGWRIAGEKKFVTLATEADFAIVLARFRSGPEHGRLGAFVVPAEGFEVVETHELIAGSALQTSRIRVNATVGDDHLLGRPGFGLAVLNWGLTKERMAVAALVVGTCRLALTLAVTHATLRQQFGRRLIDHQALRLRLADLDARLHTISSELWHLAGRPSAPRRIAGLKVTAARFGERCLSECMHIFGGDGYLDTASPLGRLWRDIRLARIGGGTDEMMWEIVASGFKADLDVYRRHVPHSFREPRGKEQV